MRIEKEFAPLVAIEMILTETELKAATTNPTSCSSEAVRQILDEYSSSQKVAEKMPATAEKIDFKDVVAILMGTNRSELDEARVFVSDKLWKLYSALIAVHGRLGFLVSKSMESGEEAIHWKTDPHMRSIVSGTLASESWDQIKRLEMSGFTAMVALLKLTAVPQTFKYPGGGVGVAGEPGAAGRGWRGAGGGRRG